VHIICAQNTKRKEFLRKRKGEGGGEKKRERESESEREEGGEEACGVLIGGEAQ
jgi:hypothetical protein